MYDILIFLTLLDPIILLSKYVEIRKISLSLLIAKKNLIQLKACLLHFFFFVWKKNPFFWKNNYLYKYSHVCYKFHKNKNLNKNKLKLVSNNNNLLTFFISKIIFDHFKINFYYSKQPTKASFLKKILKN